MKKEEKYLTTDDNVLNNVLDKIKIITCIRKFDDPNISTDTNDKFPDDITLKYVVRFAQKNDV